MRVEAQVGPQALSDGALAVPRLGRYGEQMMQQSIGADHYEGCLRGVVFHATTATAGVTLSAAGTAAGLVLANPAGSGKNIGIIKVALTVVSGTFVVGGIHHGVNTNTVAAAVTGTTITPVPGLAGSSFAASGRAFATATLPAAQTILRPFSMKNATPPWLQLAEDVDGQIALSPGASWSLFSSGADTAPVVIIGVSWIETAV